MGKKQAEKYIKEYIARLKPNLNSYKIILYGSFTKGTYKHGESDIDLLVISNDFKKISPLNTLSEALRTGRALFSA